MREEFQVHKLNELGFQRAEKLGEIFSQCLNNLESIIPNPSREFSLVVTKLQEASFFAKRAIATNKENQLE